MFYDPQGRVDEYVTYKLSKLREHVDHIFFVSNSRLEAGSAVAVAAVADTVWERENVGFDVWAYKEAMERFGRDRLAEFDELILLNYTFFGPIFPFSELFERMDALDVDFWGISEHDTVVPHPHTGRGVMPAHIQSHWIAVRRQMFTSQAFLRYWDEMPMITSYNESIDLHEARFTSHFASLGYRYEVAFPRRNYPADHPIFDNAELMLRDRCPILKRRVFFHDPLYLDRYAIVGKDVMTVVESAGFPTDLIWSNVARSAKPRVLATNMALTEVLPDVPVRDEPLADHRVAVVMHVFHTDMLDDLLAHADNLPGPYQLFVTTNTVEKQRDLQERLAAWAAQPYEVRVVASNRGRDISAFLIDCADVIDPDRFDLVVKLHSKKSPQDDYNAATLFRRHLFENLLPSPGYAANLVRLFARHQSLGMVFPPVIHMGYPTLGHAWFANKKPALAIAARLGITVPFDDSTPLSPYGSMFVARPAALQRMVNAGFTHEDFPAEGAYRDGALSHVLERLFSYCALTDGFHVRTVLSTYYASVYYSFLEYKLQNVSAHLPAFAIEQEAALAQPFPPVLAVVKHRVASSMPGVAARLRPVYRSVRKAAHELLGRLP